MVKKNAVIIGSDHAGFALKEHLKKALSELAIPFTDIGATSPEPSDDYPVYISKVAGAVSTGEYSSGIAIDGMGIGASIVANRFPRVRGSLCLNSDMARVARAHNDANILIMGGWVVSPWLADEVLRMWLKTKFEGGRHARRINLIDDETRINIALNHLDSLEATELPSDRIDEILIAKASKGIERIRELFSADDRRVGTEARLSESCPTTIHHGSQKLAALMIDLTDSGAQFKLSTLSKRFSLKSEDTIELEIKTPYGKSKATAKVIWVDRSFYTTFGVKFTKLSNDTNDPLRSLMDSM